jgi:hypothetical protein
MTGAECQLFISGFKLERGDISLDIPFYRITYAFSCKKCKLMQTYANLCNLQMQAKRKRTNGDCWAFRRFKLNRSYTLKWRKIWSNRVFMELGRKFSRLEA